MQEIDPEDYLTVADICGVADCLVREIVYMNDEGEIAERDTPAVRYARMRAWIAKRIKD